MYSLRDIPVSPHQPGQYSDLLHWVTVNTCQLAMYCFNMTALDYFKKFVEFLETQENVQSLHFYLIIVTGLFLLAISIATLLNRNVSTDCNVVYLIYTYN